MRNASQGRNANSVPVLDIRDFVDGLIFNVLIGNDGSGSIRVEDVGGSLTVEDDGSGGIRYDRVSGRVRLPD